jgi:hypothetical protein
MRLWVKGKHSNLFLMLNPLHTELSADRISKLLGKAAKNVGLDLKIFMGDVELDRIMHMGCWKNKDVAALCAHRNEVK